MNISLTSLGFGERATVWDAIHQFAVYLVVATLLMIILIPLAIVVSVSFTAPEGVFTQPGILIPDPLTFQNWVSGFDILAQGLIHSIIIATGTAIIALFVTIPGAYVFGRKDFLGKRAVFYAVVLTMLFPTVVLIVPVTVRWLEWGLYNSYLGLWIAFQIFITPLVIWILRDFFRDMPENLEEAAQVYGCTEFGAFVRVILPIATPALIAVGFLAFLNAWNEFLFASLLTTSNGVQPAIIHLYATLHGGQGESIAWGLVMAETLIIGIPPAILYFAAQRGLEGVFD